MQKFVSKVITIVQLQALENKTAIDISDQKLKKALSKLKIEQQLLNKIGRYLNEESENDNKVKAFEFVIESQKSEVQLEKNGYERKRK